MSSREAALAEVERHTWLYTVDLGGGVKTKGIFGPPNPQIMSVFDQVDFRGKKVLDVGCFEGHWSFEAEKRGAAAVYATDYLVGDPRAVVTERGVKELPTFRLAHSIRGSSVRYHPDVSVLDILRLGEKDFDIVIFCGVYYHLKHALLAFSRLRQVVRDDGVLIVEGPVIDGPAEAFARFFYEETLSNDMSNWWVPTLSCLRQWVECSYFKVQTVSPPTATESRQIAVSRDAPRSAPRTELVSRYTMTARAVRGHDPRYVLPDEDLGDYDRG